MAVTGWKSPGTGANVDRDGKAAWSNPGNAAASDNAYASNTIAASTYSDWLRLTNFGFTDADIPAGATIDGIEFQYEQKAQLASTMKDSSIRARKTSGQVGTDQADTSTYWPTSDTYKTYGGPTSKLGATWTDAEIKSSDFGFDLSAQNASGIIRYAYIDHLRVRVYYTPPVVAIYPVIGGVHVIQGGGSRPVIGGAHVIQRRRTA